MLSIGEYNVKVTDWKVEKTEKNNVPYMFLLFTVVDGDSQGEEAGYKVFLLKKNGDPNEIARESLRACGWDGKDFEKMTGLGGNVVTVAVAKRTYTKNDGTTGEVTEIAGIKGIGGQRRGVVADKAEVKNLAKLFSAKGKVDSNDDPCSSDRSWG